MTNYQLPPTNYRLPNTDYRALPWTISEKQLLGFCLTDRDQRCKLTLMIGRFLQRRPSLVLLLGVALQLPCLACLPNSEEREQAAPRCSPVPASQPRPAVSVRLGSSIDCSEDCFCPPEPGHDHSGSTVLRPRPMKRFALVMAIPRETIFAERERPLRVDCRVRTSPHTLAIRTVILLV